jgi:hypothetical protein
MAAVTTGETLDMAFVDRLRHLASQGAGLDQMVSEVQAGLGFSPNFIVPVLGYFCQAFSLPLIDVLPLREWVETKDNQQIEKLLTRIKEFQNSK